MRRFKFRLDKVLEMRGDVEKEKAGALAAARSVERGARAARAALVQQRNAGRERLAVAHRDGGTVGHIQNLAYVIGCVDDQIQLADDACAQAAQAVTDSLSDFRDAYAGRKSLDQLRDRRKAAWQVHANRKEQNAMDEVAMTRHVRANSTSG